MSEHKHRRNKDSAEDSDEFLAEDSIRSLLFRGRKLSPIKNVAVRLSLAAGALVITAMVVYFERGCYADRGVTGTLTWVDAIYYSTVSLSTTGYGDIVPICESSRIANVFIITPLRFLFLIVLVGTTIEVLTKKTRTEIRSRAWRKKVENHTIIIGYGVKGRSAGKASWTPATTRTRLSLSHRTASHVMLQPVTASSHSSVTEDKKKFLKMSQSSGPAK